LPFAASWGDNGFLERNVPMKSMKLYTNVQRIHNELAALGIGPEAALRVDQLTPFDQYHYFGTDAVDEALEALQLQPGSRILDVGSGIGGPARYIAAKTGAHVTALELQRDLNEVARDLTVRCGLSSRVAHVCGNILDGVAAENYDGIISFLCFLHIPERAKLFAACRAALKPGGVMYIEDFGKSRALSADEAKALSVKVQCAGLPGRVEYESHLVTAGFADVSTSDVTASWKDFTASRLAMFRMARARGIEVHGREIMDDLDDFYGTVAQLFQDGAIAGLKIIAR
jgi:cyclopropane fatty-acyl-phospholipid synthase-like methyltransferase